MNTPDVDRAGTDPNVQQCAQCGTALLPIVYGFPGPDMFDAAERGEIVLGGCMLDVGNPTRGCPCGATTAGTLGDEDDHATFDVDATRS